MPETPDDAACEPDWVIDLNASPPPTIDDPRLPLAAEVLHAAQLQLQAIAATTAAIEEVVRDASSHGVRRDALAVELSLSIETVDRILAGGTIFDWP